MTNKLEGERGTIGHTEKERHPFFLPLFNWASKIENISISSELEIVLNKLSAVWSRAEKDQADSKPVDHGVEEFIACLEEVSKLENICPVETEDFKHLNNIKIALKDVLLPQLEKMQKLV